MEREAPYCSTMAFYLYASLSCAVIVKSQKNEKQWKIPAQMIMSETKAKRRGISGQQPRKDAHLLNNTEGVLLWFETETCLRCDT